MRTPESNKRSAARSLKDVDIPESSWKADFEIIDRYQNFGNELMRLALLGITGYGFLIHELCIKRIEYQPILEKASLWVFLGVLFLVVSIVLVLMYRFFSSKCLFCQVQIMRSLKRNENEHWSDFEKEQEAIFLKDIRVEQQVNSKLSDKILKGAAVAFGLGFIFVLLVFYQFLDAIVSN